MREGVSIFGHPSCMLLALSKGAASQERMQIGRCFFTRIVGLETLPRLFPILLAILALAVNFLVRDIGRRNKTANATSVEMASI